MNIKRALLILVVILVCAEIGLRFIHAFYYPDMKVGSLANFTDSSEYPWRMRAGVKVVQPERYGDRQYHFNQDGYRAVNAEQKNGVCNIIFLGDSITFGLGVEVENTFSDKLTSSLQLSDESIGQQKLALFGYSIGSEVSAFKKYAKIDKTRFIVLQMYMNDFERITKRVSNSEGAQEMQNAEQPRITLGQAFFILKEQLITRSALAIRLRQVIHMIVYYALHDLKREYFPDRLNASEPINKLKLLETNPDDKQITAFVETLDLQAWLKKTGLPLIVFLSPNEVQLFTHKFDAINTRFMRFCESSQLKCFDPLEDMRSLPDEIKNKLFLDGLHLSETGHEFVANWLNKNITESFGSISCH